MPKKFEIRKWRIFVGRATCQTSQDKRSPKLTNLSVSAFPSRNVWKHQKHICYDLNDQRGEKESEAKQDITLEESLSSQIIRILHMSQPTRKLLKHIKPINYFAQNWTIYKKTNIWYIFHRFLAPLIVNLLSYKIACKNDKTPEVHAVFQIYLYFSDNLYLQVSYQNPVSSNQLLDKY